MSSISSLLSQLSSYNSSNSLLGSASTGANVTQALEQALQQADGSAGSSDDAFLLDLSPGASQMLSSTATSADSTSDSSNFTLTSAQQTTVKNILEKYKDAPYTQQTFDAIESALQKAGLGAQQLGLEDSVQNFNATGILLGDLNGNYTNVGQDTPSSQTEQTKESNYMQSILSAWQSISTTYTAANTTASA